MKIGILTYHSAINFGANLQAFSTYNYLENHGFEPYIINFHPIDLKNSYSSFPKEQIIKHQEFVGQMRITKECVNARDIAMVLEDLSINNVIIGSDAVAQHHPLLSRIVFPSRRLISISKVTSDRMFPNPFWGEFLKFKANTNVCLLSVSSQQADYLHFTKTLREDMMQYLSKFSFISVRDEWTKEMYEHISNNKIIPEVTPDPVFAFNENCDKYIPSKEEIKNRFKLPEKYVLLSIRKGKSVLPQWSKDFETICQQAGYTCIGLPFPYGFTELNQTSRKIELPLSPIEWYSIIKYSDGFVGHNMHTIVSALHNSVPCYSFDQYGRRILMQFCNNHSSKIFDILQRAGFEDFRCVSGTVIDRTPSPSCVFEKLMSFDRCKCEQFAKRYHSLYEKMMSNIVNTFV